MGEKLLKSSLNIIILFLKNHVLISFKIFLSFFKLFNLCDPSLGSLEDISQVQIYCANLNSVVFLRPSSVAIYSLNETYILYFILLVSYSFLSPSFSVFYFRPVCLFSSFFLCVYSIFSFSLFLFPCLLSTFFNHLVLILASNYCMFFSFFFILSINLCYLFPFSLAVFFIRYELVSFFRVQHKLCGVFSFLT